MLATTLGPLGPASDLTTGSDLPPWARVNTWTVGRWRYVLDRYRYLFCEMPIQSGTLRVPGLGRVLLFDLAPLVQRTTEKPTRRPGLIGWLAMVLHLEPAHVRRARLVWRIRCKVQALMVADFNRSVALHLEPADPFAPISPPIPNPPPRQR